MSDFQYKAVLFDLDGTLVDTAPDLQAALNYVLEYAGKPLMSLEQVKTVATYGSSKLTRLGFGDSLSPEEHENIRTRLLDYYETHLTVYSDFMPGVEKLLETLESRGILWGVVTNKPERFTNPLMEEMKLDQRAATVISCDTTEHAKPHPAPMLEACRQMKLTPDQCLFIGDADRDVEAGRAAGMKTVAYTAGYILPDENIESWGADFVVDHFDEVIELLF